MNSSVFSIDRSISFTRNRNDFICRYIVLRIIPVTGSVAMPVFAWSISVADDIKAIRAILFNGMN